MVSALDENAHNENDEFEESTQLEHIVHFPAHRRYLFWDDGSASKYIYIAPSCWVLVCCAKKATEIYTRCLHIDYALFTQKSWIHDINWVIESISHIYFDDMKK